MSTAATAQPSVVRSSSRRQQNGAPQRTSSHHGRSQSSAQSDQPQQQQQHQQQSAEPPSYSQPQREMPVLQPTGLNGVARRDYETTNVARPQQPGRRSSSRDRSHQPAPLPAAGPRPDGQPHRTSSRQTPVRYSSDMGRASSSATRGAPQSHRNGGSAYEGQPAGSGQPPQATPTSRRRTQVEAQTGTWALGKTIGAGSMGKVKIARNAETGEQVAIKIVPRQSTEEHQTQREKDRADHSKEVRTAREAAIVTLLNHPYICGMRDVVRTNYHWYMLFEYVNGGQMLDYIISHGRLKEKPARKFSRQIASALDYCHRNSIVHRDLKIENILISKTGDIKIIDFGLSNLYSPRSYLKTFCGSLYFAAPELLQARQYTGPEVDVWSFGIVLYVLLCGKVPFDDQSMPQLHQKIKKGVVDYPGWLGLDCKHLISRMLVTDPKGRATLTEVMLHGWMTKGFNAPPENFLPHREPLQLPLDQSVIEKMTGFDFGAPEYISRELTRIIESEEYQAAVAASIRDSQQLTPSIEKKRGVFEFYKRRNSTTSRDALTSTSSVEQVQLGPDLVTAFSPLISIYYLAREKQERERTETNPGALSLPLTPDDKPLKMPDLAAPEAAHTNSNTYEMPGEKATGGRSRPRARTHGEDELEATKPQTERSADQVSPAIVTTLVPTQQPTAKKESMAGGLLRRFSTRRGKENVRAGLEPTQSQTPPSLALQPPIDEPTTPKKSFSMRRSRSKDPNAPMIHSAGSQPQHANLLTPPVASGGALSRAGSRLLKRSTSVNSADRRPRQVQQEQLASPSLEPPATSGSDKSSLGGPKVKINEPPASDTKPTTQRLNTQRTKSLGHARRESIQARRARRHEARQSNVPEETDQELATEDQELTDSGEGQTEAKPVFLKGLFSVKTTSTKPISAIRADIIRVLREVGVEYNEIKGGFSCRHAPSIEHNRLSEKSPASPDAQGLSSPNHRRRISFGGLRANDRERDDLREGEKSARSSSRRRAPDNSFVNSEDSDDERLRRRPADRPAGETSTHVQNDMGENQMLKFEIFIVKVPLIGIHGIQFKKVDGGTWQYKNMASKILTALRW